MACRSSAPRARAAGMAAAALLLLSIPQASSVKPSAADARSGGSTGRFLASPQAQGAGESVLVAGTKGKAIANTSTANIPDTALANLSMDTDNLPGDLVHHNGRTVTSDWRQEVPEYRNQSKHETLGPHSGALPRWSPFLGGDAFPHVVSALALAVAAAAAS
mmetsp:Transcript_91059/g.257843  ORF Transcript_91059/g.257843 Transcript_91059/m.257843 type:complete len:162 (-) Transcript_91059:112-597(-)